jgi:hypothetical protein
MTDDRSARTSPVDRDLASPRSLLEDALERFGSRYAERLEELAECNRGLARLVEVRVARPWTDFEHDAYLRLRRSKTELNARVVGAQQAFERARSGLRDLGQPF